MTDVDYSGGGTIDYHYDNGSGEEYYDPLGNRQWVVVNGGAAVSYDTSGNQLNQYDTVGAATYTYDDNGNLKDIDGSAYEYIYDHENRLTESKESSSTVATYSYDYLGRRISKLVSGTTTKYCYDGWQVIAEYEGATLVRKFIYGPGIDEPIIMIDVAGSNTYWYHYDGLGSVVALWKLGTVETRDSHLLKLKT